MQHAFFLNQSQVHCWAEVTLIIFPLVGFHEKDVKMACLWKSAGRGSELIMSNLVKASLVWEIVINKAWRHLRPLQAEPHLAWLIPSRDKKPALTPAGPNCVDCLEQRNFTLHPPPPSAEKLSSKKPVPDAKNVGDRWSSTHLGDRAAQEVIVLILQGRRLRIAPLIERHQFFLWLGQPYRWGKTQIGKAWKIQN